MWTGCISLVSEWSVTFCAAESPGGSVVCAIGSSAATYSATSVSLTLSMNHLSVPASSSAVTVSAEDDGGSSSVGRSATIGTVAVIASSLGEPAGSAVGRPSRLCC